MNKNRIRLTESQLHNIIKESARQILSELNWKTLDNAANKMRERGDADYWKLKGEKFPNTISKAADARLRAERLAQASKDAFNRDYGYKNGEWLDDDYAEVGMGGDFGYTDEFAPHAAAWKHDGVALKKQFPHGVYTHERTPEEFFDGNPNSEDAVNAFNTAKDEIQNFKKGNYEYEPNGRGWHLKDNMDESIRRAIRRVLKESSPLNYRQLINMTDINDNDEWNAAAIAEEREELEGKIWRAISEKLCNGGNPRKVAFHFTDLVKLMDKFGFKYEGNDDNDESINFSDSYGEFVIWPTIYYPKMDLLRIDNSHLT